MSDGQGDAATSELRHDARETMAELLRLVALLEQFIRSGRSSEQYLGSPLWRRVQEAIR